MQTFHFVYTYHDVQKVAKFPVVIIDILRNNILFSLDIITEILTAYYFYAMILKTPLN